MRLFIKLKQLKEGNNMPTADEKIVLGSGKLYITEFVGEVIPTDEILEIEDNLLGLISGGATAVYKPKFYEAKDDLGLVSNYLQVPSHLWLRKIWACIQPLLHPR